MIPKPKQATQPLSKKRLRLWLKLLKASSLIEDEIRRRFRNDHDWTLPRFDVMAALSRAPDGLKMGEISKLLRVSGGNVTGIVDKLTEEDLALRVAVPGDRRAQLVRLTAKGCNMFAAHSTAHEAWIDEILGKLDENDIKDMMARLDRMNETLNDEKKNAN